MEVVAVDEWGDSKNEFILFSFCERQFSTLTSYWRTTWVDNMNANKIRKKRHQYEEREAGGFGRRIKLDLTGYVNKASRSERDRERERERERASQTRQRSIGVASGEVGKPTAPSCST